MTNSTVFLVDDEEDVRTTLSRALTKRGFKVVAFESAESFFEHYQLDQRGCLVLDYGMPDINGLELHSLINEMSFSRALSTASNTASG